MCKVGQDGGRVSLEARLYASVSENSETNDASSQVSKMHASPSDIYFSICCVGSSLASTSAPTVSVDSQGLSGVEMADPSVYLSVRHNKRNLPLEMRTRRIKLKKRLKCVRRLAE